MSERNLFHRPGSVGNGTPGNDEGGLRAPPGLSPLRKVWWWFHFLVLIKLARLRFIAVLVAIGLVVAKWDLLSAWYEKQVRPLLGQETAVSPDTEYWCPMHPTIVRDHPDKCPLCGMPLSRRKKGDKREEEALPPGVVGRRVQLTPYKVAVAGIETAAVDYRTLTRDIDAVGFVEFDEQKLKRITARATGKSRIDRLFVNVTGQTVEKGEPLAELYSPDLVVTVQNLLDARQAGDQRLERMNRDRLRLWGIDADQIDEIVRTGKPITHVTIRSPISGHVIKKYQVEGEYVEEGTRLYDVADLSAVWIEAQVYEDELALLKEGLPVTATTRAYPDREFRGTLLFINPHLDATTRTLMVRFDMKNPGHALRPGMYATVKLQVPVTRLDLLPSDASADRKEKYREGQVLTVSERSVIDTGSHTFVYRESEPDIYEGVEVELGPRCGGFYPVVRGLQAGERVVPTGSFLIDAETRLSAGVSSTYFGASGGPHGDQRSATTAARPSMTREEDAQVRARLARLSPEDRRLVEEQGACPVLGGRLGAMGVPVPIVLEGRKVFLCCKGCLQPAKANAKATLARVDELKARVKSGGSRAPAPAPAPAGEKEAKIQTNLGKLDAEDRRLAEAQRYCPIQQHARLGQMGVPVPVEIRGRKVFLCCKSCKDEALADPGKTLAEVEKLKARAARQR